MESVYNLGKERAHSRELILTLDCGKDMGSITADARRLKQALFNLLSNSLKFTPEGGEVTLSVERSGNDFLFAVADTGIGIPEEDQERVFGRFERGTGQGRQVGAGLGLALVQSLIELHGGTVELESSIDGGTRVTCRVPDGGAQEAIAIQP